MNEKQQEKVVKDLVNFREVVCQHQERLIHDEVDSKIDWKEAYLNLNREAFDFSNDLATSVHLGNHTTYKSRLEFTPVKWKIVTDESNLE